MIKIPLVGKFKGKYALVDDCDDWVLKLRWTGWKDRTGNIYAIVSSRKEGLHSQRLHRLILGLKKGDSEVDHIDGDGLNNLRSNLRLATKSQNGMNMRKRKGTSKYKGVCWYKPYKKWRTQIMKDYRQMHIGYYISEIDAAKAYDKKAKELFGKYVRLNFLNNDRGINKYAKT